MWEAAGLWGILLLIGVGGFLIVDKVGLFLDTYFKEEETDWSKSTEKEQNPMKEAEKCEKKEDSLKYFRIRKKAEISRKSEEEQSAVEYLGSKRRPKKSVQRIWEIGKCFGVLLVATLIGYLFEQLGFSGANIITVYIFGVLIISLITTHRVYSLVSSVISVLVFNFFFTMPRFSLNAYETGYPVTFFIMFLSAFLTSSLALQLKSHARQSAQAAFRTQILLETNQKLQKEREKEGIVAVTANQLTKLLSRDIIYYPAEGEKLLEPQMFRAEGQEHSNFSGEKEVALWALQNKKKAGAGTEGFSEAKSLYLAVRMNDTVYGVVGIAVGKRPIEEAEYGILLSILGECAFALENEKTAREKEDAAVLAKNEQLRANLLRAISHDLRTPLTSISGNASNLISNSGSFDEETKLRLYTDIYDDSMWLIKLVENLLAVTRIEEGRVNLNLSTELMDEVIEEALQHVNREKTEHVIEVENPDSLILARMDARLIMQVFINLVDNAVKYTPKGSYIRISVVQKEKWVVTQVSDDGPGMSDEVKKHVFEMFYTGANKVADSHRSLGLGLSLCKSIVNAHGGEIRVEDNHPHGAVFTFTLPAGEVKLHE